MTQPGHEEGVIQHYPTRLLFLKGPTTRSSPEGGISFLVRGPAPGCRRIQRQKFVRLVLLTP
jgi:hypothetical protein